MKIARIVPIAMNVIVGGLILANPTLAFAQACTTPAVVPNVLVEYPACQGDQCYFAQASCSWGQVADAASYSVKVTEVETGKQIRNQTVSSSTTSIIFPVQNYTYKCDVSAVNACGTTGPAGTHSLFCPVQDAPAATATPRPPVTTQPPASLPPVLPKTGSSTTVMLLVSLGLTMLVASSMVFSYTKKQPE